ncbi:hypothetical protein [Bosea sp. WAO]|uniref:hypothetical protein n=1 Tax=Bosea sp. WAO TaxID=406341 RepID=UPI000AB29735|nr:hypothetical protein [Bosea sp. WAO]
MARAALDWTTADLAAAAVVGVNTVNRFEAGQDARMSSVEKLKVALQSAGVEFIDDARGEGVLKLRLPARQAATEAEMNASADTVRSQAAAAVDEALIGSDATAEQKAERRGALTDEPAVIGRARGKGRGKLL